jgi:hypothetical protein
MPTSNEYHEGVEACYRLAGEARPSGIAWRDEQHS